MQENHYSSALGKCLCLAFIFVFSFYNSILAQEQLGRPLINQYTYQEYGARPINWWVTESDDGIMYFANTGGILQFDGVNWDLIEIPGLAARCLVKDNEGVIYVGGVGEFGYLAPSDTGVMEYVSLMDKVPEEHKVFDVVWEVDYYQGRIIYRT